MYVIKNQFNPYKIHIMEDENKSKQKVIVGVILLILLILLASYTIYQNNQLDKSNTFLEEEKASIEKNLDEMVAKYDDAIAENSTLSDELKLEREDIILLRDSVKNLKATNYSIIRRYRNKISSLEKSNQELFRLNDSLRISNNLLAQNLEIAQDSIQTQVVQIDSLNFKNDILNQKVAVGEILTVHSVKAIAMKERFNGKMVATTRANRSDLLRINFTIAENAIAEKSQRHVLVQIINPKGAIINVVGTTTLENGEEIDFSDETNVDYDNQNLTVISVINVNRKEMLKGTYKVIVYLNNSAAAASAFTLK